MMNDLFLNLINQSNLMWHWDKGRGISFQLCFPSQLLREILWLCSAVLMQLSCTHAAVLAWPAFWHEVQHSSAAVLCHQILPNPLFLLEHKGGW